MNVFKRYATVVYDSRNLSIRSVESITSPESAKIDPLDLMRLYTKALTPHINVTSDDTIMTNAALFQIGLVLRLMQDDFPNNQDTPLNFLRGFLTIPIQFTVSAWQFVNATVFALDPQSSRYALPPDLEATASPAQVTYRTVSTRPWTFYVFSAVLTALVLYSISLFTFIRWHTPHGLTIYQSLYPEIDVTSMASCPPKNDESHKVDGGLDYSSALRNSGLRNADSKTVLKRIGGMNIRIVHVNVSDEGTVVDGLKYPVLVVTRPSREGAVGVELGSLGTLIDPEDN
jgi:hypothetical protein